MLPSRAMTGKAVGRSVPRREADAKLRGQARYVGDVTMPGMLHGATVRSQVARGRLRAIHFGPEVRWDEYVVVTAADIVAAGGVNTVALIVDHDQPALVGIGDIIAHREEPVVLLAHPDPHALEPARRAIRLEVEPLPAVLTLDEALAARTVVYGEDNVIKSYGIDKGDVVAAFAAAEVVSEGVYETGAQEQLYIENNGMIGAIENGDVVTVWGSMQCPYYVQKGLMKCFGVGPERARVVQLETGGGFGGKEEYPSILGIHVALLARKAGRPVRILYDRGEDMAATTKRHPSRTRVRSAARRDGTLTALDIDFVLDGGAYATLSQVVLSRGTIHAAGPYSVANVRVRGRAMATSTPPHGAFRGFGAPQSIFALERHLDEVAHKLGITPEALRRKNFVAKGGELATGQLVRDDIDLGALLGSALAAADWERKRTDIAAERARSGAPLRRRGLGLATFLHGTGFTGSGEKYLASVVGLEGMSDGRVRVLASSTEIGQGTQTVFAQIAADALGVDMADVEVATPDTRDVPNSGPTVASRTCTIVGKLVESAAHTLRARLVAAGLLPGDGGGDLRAAVQRHLATVGPLRALAQYEAPPYVKWDEVAFRGDAYGAYSWGVYVAEVEVDMLTYEARVLDFVAAQEVGRVIHPVLAAGQIEGGVAQGIGWALYENVVWRDGVMSNNRMTDYIMPTSADIPPIRVLFAESPYPYGPFGAKGIGELPMDGPAPAILNAIEDALGVSIRRIPATPEVIMDAIEGSGTGAGAGSGASAAGAA